MKAKHNKNIAARVQQGILTLALIMLVAGCNPFAKNDGPCEGREWTGDETYLDCKFPDPPAGRWKAVYTADFAKAYDLPPENISTDLSPGVDYMEMDVVPKPYKPDDMFCLVNMLIQRPNDVAMHNGTIGKEPSWSAELHESRKLARFIDLEAHKAKLKNVATFGLSERNPVYRSNRSYSNGSAMAFVAENIIDGYDYATIEASCYYLLSRKSMFPDKWALSSAKASVWGRYEPKYRYILHPDRPKDKAYFDSRTIINIPHELIETVFEDMPIGGR